MIDIEKLKEEVEEKLNHKWDGKIYAYQDNSCEYVDITDTLSQAIETRNKELVEIGEGLKRKFYEKNDFLSHRSDFNNAFNQAIESYQKLIQSK